ncbi:hypothetical protein MHL31_07030 [Lutibacter sp. A80]|uniref:hypothetical protein n=1 Tax=Lutibacter sp. A80 TaxID=2918453 RepID=UPI001F059C9C|nr:hypothetical protein [Lutibacter sp. A80]UMB61940.1 hypothetical protein MHL31_07030 [Lutibacter sp. A80]
MIRYLKRNQLDDNKYNACLEASVNSRIYAFSWYLDCVADNWDALVLNDYEAVMPLPFLKRKRHFFLRKIDQPPFCQQLGVFSVSEISKEQFQLFIYNFLKLKPRSYNFNIFNFKVTDLIKDNCSEKVNLELNLMIGYNEIERNYSKNLKRNIKKAKDNQLKIAKNISLKDFILLKKENSNHKISIKNFNKLEKLIKELSLRKLGFTYGVYFKEELVSAAFFLDYNKRLIHLFSATTQQGKIYGAMSLLFNSIIEQHIADNEILDFEGSMIPGIAKFFKSFGAKKFNYYSFKN